MFTGELISCWWGPVQPYRQPVSFCTGALVCCGASRKVISRGEDFLGVLPIFHTKWPEHIFHSCHLQIGWLLLDKVKKEIGKWVPVCFLSQSHRTLSLGQTFFFSSPLPPFKIYKFPRASNCTRQGSCGVDSEQETDFRLAISNSLSATARQEKADNKSLS